MYLYDYAVPTYIDPQPDVNINIFSALAVSAGYWPTFLYNDVCLGFQQSSVLLDDFITTENDVLGSKRKSRFRLDEPDTR